MIQKVESYQAHCDICGIKSELYTNPTKLALMLRRRGWVINGNSCVCSNCHQYDKEKDEYKPKVKED